MVDEKLEILASVQSSIGTGLRRESAAIESFSARSRAALNRLQGAGRDAFATFTQNQLTIAALTAGGVLFAQRFSRSVIRVLKDFAVAASRAAATAEEIENRFQVTFGASAETAAENLAFFGDVVGRSETRLKEFAATLQDTFVPFGFSREEAARLSEEIVKLGIDVASFKDIADADALNRFQSALVGNSEAVLRLGINLKESTVQAEALRAGLIREGEVLSEQAKVRARINLLFAQTKDAQNDAARTAESFTNQQKRLKDATFELQVEIGQRLNRALLEGVREAGGLDAALDSLEDVAFLTGGAMVGLTERVGSLSASIVKLSSELPEARELLFEFGERGVGALFAKIAPRLFLIERLSSGIRDLGDSADPFAGVPQETGLDAFIRRSQILQEIRAQFRRAQREAARLNDLERKAIEDRLRVEEQDQRFEEERLRAVGRTNLSLNERIQLFRDLFFQEQERIESLVNEGKITSDQADALTDLNIQLRDERIERARIERQTELGNAKIKESERAREREARSIQLVEEALQRQLDLEQKAIANRPLLVAGIREFGFGAAQAFGSFVSGAEKGSEALDRFIGNLVQRIATASAELFLFRQLLAPLFSGAFGVSQSSFLSFFGIPFQRGGAVGPGGQIIDAQRGITPDQRGEVTRGTTIRPLVRFGEAGEAGEGVLPLTRDRLGRLSVHSVGGGGGVSVTVNFNGNVGSRDGLESFISGGEFTSLIEEALDRIPSFRAAVNNSGR